MLSFVCVCVCVCVCVKNLGEVYMARGSLGGANREREEMKTGKRRPSEGKNQEGSPFFAA